jgi:hypothetical protein
MVPVKFWLERCSDALHGSRKIRHVGTRVVNSGKFHMIFRKFHMVPGKFWEIIQGIYRNISGNF